jgi:hypothetical protein
VGASTFATPRMLALSWWQLLDGNAHHVLDEMAKRR